MTEVPRGFNFRISETATSELRELKRRDPDSFDTIIVLLQEIRTDARICEQLIDEHYSDDTIRQVEPFWAAQDEGMNAYTVKLYEAAGWRLITAGDHRAGVVAIMSFMKRNRDYQADKALMENLRRDYDALGLTRRR